MRVVGISPLPFVVTFLLGRSLEETARQAFSATGNDPWLLFNNPIALIFILLSAIVIVVSTRRLKGSSS